MSALRTAAVAGVGVVQLPAMLVADELHSGRLVRLLPDWAPRREVVHAVFPSRRGLLPAVRVFIDFLAEHLPQQIEASRLDCGGKCSEAAERALELALDNARAGKVKKAS